MVLLVNHENNQGKFIVTSNEAEAITETTEKHSEDWEEKTSKLLNIYFNS